ncbi:hypothetical protein [Castellaniella ginsengisoli]|uniref:Uncharacterized protein n=1 Tax=Castellaniella ginsengisoli TaxID=546114 RepID=A0AB39DBJ3_9BURK
MAQPPRSRIANMDSDTALNQQKLEAGMKALGLIPEDAPWQDKANFMTGIVNGKTTKLYSFDPATGTAFNQSSGTAAVADPSLRSGYTAEVGSRTAENRAQASSAYAAAGAHNAAAAANRALAAGREWNNAEKAKGDGAEGAPFEVSQNGVPVLVQRYRDGSIRTVEGFQPKLREGLSITTNPDGTVSVSTGGGKPQKLTEQQSKDLVCPSDAAASRRSRRSRRSVCPRSDSKSG